MVRLFSFPDDSEFIECQLTWMLQWARITWRHNLKLKKDKKALSYNATRTLHMHWRYHQWNIIYGILVNYFKIPNECNRWLGRITGPGSNLVAKVSTWHLHVAEYLKLKILLLPYSRGHIRSAYITSLAKFGGSVYNRMCFPIALH